MEIQQITRAPDDFQQPVNEEALRAALARELPAETLLSITELKAGLFNNAYRVNTANSAYILKVAPPEAADVFYPERFLMQRERAIAPALQSASPLVPPYLAFFEIDGRDAFLQPLIEGRLWHDEEQTLTEVENAALWEQLGVFAQTMHSFRGTAFGFPDPCSAFDRWSAFITNTVDGLIRDCERLGVMSPEIEMYRELLPRFIETLDQVATSHLLHGDLWPRNVLFEGAGTDIRIQAVFDGERAFWGDPVSDWVLILYGVPDAFWQGYGENLTKTVDPARIAVYKGMYFILNILEAVRFQNPDEEPKRWLSAINEELRRLKK